MCFKLPSIKFNNGPKINPKERVDGRMKKEHMVIDVSLVRRLIASRFPKWKELPIDPVAISGWDNRTFHLGKDMSVRLPSAAEYELQVEKEHQFSPCSSASDAHTAGHGES